MKWFWSSPTFRRTERESDCGGGEDRKFIFFSFTVKNCLIYGSCRKARRNYPRRENLSSLSLYHFESYKIGYRFIVQMRRIEYSNQNHLTEISSLFRFSYLIRGKALNDSLFLSVCLLFEESRSESGF